MLKFIKVDSQGATTFGIIDSGKIAHTWFNTFEFIICSAGCSEVVESDVSNKIIFVEEFIEDFIDDFNKDKDFKSRVSECWFVKFLDEMSVKELVEFLEQYELTERFIKKSVELCSKLI